MPDTVNDSVHQRFDQLLAVDPPRAFAIVEVDDERPDGEIAAWGMAFANGIQAHTTSGGSSFHLASPERLLWLFNLHMGVTAHLVWLSDAR